MARIQESENPQCLFLSDFKEEIKSMFSDLWQANCTVDCQIYNY